MSHELRDALGRRVYISFVAVRVTSECMEQFMEGDLLQYASSRSDAARRSSKVLHSWGGFEDSGNPRCFPYSKTLQRATKTRREC